MKRIETLTEVDRLAIVRTLNDAAINGKTSYSCLMNDFACTGCPVANACSGVHVGDLSAKTFIGWLNWLRDEVEATAIRSGYRVLYTKRMNHFHIERPDGVNLYANGQPWALLPIDRDRKSEFVITDVFASRYGTACILVEDTYTGEMVLYSDIL